MSGDLSISSNGPAVRLHQSSLGTRFAATGKASFVIKSGKKVRAFEGDGEFQEASVA
jgi:hypothetical protein